MRTELLRAGSFALPCVAPSRVFLIALLAALSIVALGPDSLQAATATGLRFSSSAGLDKEVSLDALREVCPPSEVEVDDPYHGRAMRYFAMPLVCVLESGFSSQGGAAGLRDRSILLKALDGYTRPAQGSDLLDEAAALAYGEVALMEGPFAEPKFSPIDRRQSNPAPFYLVWTGIGQNDPHSHPWPYQLARIEIASFAEAFPRTEPKGLANADPGWGGYAIFQRACVACHAINGEGGTVGPELNVPKSIVEYRPVEQIKGYIRDPEATRYTSMPAHPELTPSDLDALIAYFRAMSERKHDPRHGGSS